jgi:hypothetical protein
MNDAEMRNENEYYRMKTAELEKGENAADRLIGIIDNEKQRYSDIVALSHDDKARAAAQNKWKALDDLQKEFEQIQV